ncbi:MAG TPA: hypothetical protein VFQ53_12430 [Kofleriaceae bacterium]|nr:hypothetical protein [Kofleriaceae bacterium]
MRSLHLVVLAIACAACGKGASSSSHPQPEDRVARGLAAFETVRSVLQHPRCQNCHPDGDAPLQGDDSHVHHQNIQRGPTGNGMVGAECTTCHRGANPPDSFGPHTPPGVVKGWHMPPPEQRLVFVGVAPGALCAQIKDPARNGGKDAPALRAHLDDPLVTWAWSPGVGRTPPPVSHRDFVAAWETWFAAGAPCP